MKSLPDDRNNPIYFECTDSANVESLDGNKEQKAQRHQENFNFAKTIVKDARRLIYRSNVNEAKFQGLMLDVFRRWNEYTENV